MSKRKSMTKDAHIDAGKNLRIVKHRLTGAVTLVSNNMPRDSIPVRKLNQALKAINTACDHLDDDWCRDCIPPTQEGDAVYEDHGFPYYGPVEK